MAVLWLINWGLLTTYLLTGMILQSGLQDDPGSPCQFFKKNGAWKAKLSPIFKAILWLVLGVSSCL